jgi:hypothetical protein
MSYVAEREGLHVDKRTQKLERELTRLRRRHVDLDRSAVELKRLGSPQASLQNLVQ